MDGKWEKIICHICGEAVNQEDNYLICDECFTELDLNLENAKNHESSLALALQDAQNEISRLKELNKKGGR